ncbi:WD40 repeat-like protein [Meredithblackwellia eburnea MCA 4105]
MPVVSQIATVPIVHGFNADRSQVAISPNTNQVQIFSKGNSSNSPSGWELQTTLQDHDKLVTSIDWAPTTNRIVTCSQDRNAYVWNLSPTTGVWVPTLVLLRLNRSATFVRWSPNEQKFAVASGARTIAVCQFDQESDWWVAKHVKKPLRTTVLGLDWHPNSVLLASGSADGVARVFSTFLKGVDSKPTPTVWGERLPFNTVCGEFPSPSGGWVHSVAFSPSGDTLAFASHDSTITIVYPTSPTSPPQAMYTIPLPSLPILSLLFSNEHTIVGAGHDCQPFVFEGDVGGWNQTRTLDGGLGAGKAATGATTTGGIGRLNKSEAFNMFRAADSRGVSSSSPSSSSSGLGGTQEGARVTSAGTTELLTVHQNTICSVRVHEGGGGEGGEVTKVSTSGMDGRLVVWDLGEGVGLDHVTSGVARLVV